MAENIAKNSIEYYMDKYERPVRALSSYLNWLEEHMNVRTDSVYSDSETVMPFPIYDSTLMAFIKQVQNTGILDRNCVYLYTRRRINGVKDELDFIEKARLQDMDDLWAVLSNYVIEGMSRGAKWSEGVSSGIFYHVIRKMLDLLITWSRSVPPKG